MKDSQKVTAAYTPGPWNYYDAGDERFVFYTGTMRTPAARPLGYTEHFLAADARLIAAAPELLAALERTSGTLTGVLAAIERDAGRGPAVVYEALDEARAVIAKARG